MRAEFYGEPWRTVADVAAALDVPTEAVHHLVNTGIIEYSTDRDFRTCVKLGEVTEALESNARLRLGGYAVEQRGTPSMAEIERLKPPRKLY